MIVLVALALVAGCGAEPRPVGPPPEPPVDMSFRVGDVREFALPLDAYRLSDEEFRAFDRARLLLVQRCMRRSGYAYPLPPSLPEFLGRNEKRYTLADPGRAATVGYHDPEADERSRELGAEQDMTAAEEVVLNGPQGGAGCNAEAVQQLGGTGVSGLVQSLSHEAYEQGLADSRVRQVSAAWSVCMRASGHEYADPPAANDDPAFATPAATEAEIAVATADLRCKRETNYIGVRAAVETAYQQRKVEENRYGLEAVRAGNERIRRAVAAIET